MWWYQLFFVLVLVHISVSHNNADGPTVHTENGVVKGQYSTTFAGKTYTRFRGIPYAEPPVGQLRFEEPVEKKPWSGIWYANSTTTCLQVSHWHIPEGGVTMGDEDCLYLNVYVPGDMVQEANTNMDVIIHIHGGGFMFGSSYAYAGPRYLLDRDVILVTLNYRVGIFGFMSLEDEVLPGNNGMKDQVMALKWIKNNIAKFGGNPNSITLTGLSAGGASTHLHTLSPMSKGLFHKGHAASGSAFCPWVLQKNAAKKAHRIADAVGCDLKTSRQIVDCLKTRKAADINEVIRQFRVWLVNPFTPLGVMVEKWGPNPFLAEHPLKLMEQGKVNDVPLVFSVTEDEGLYPSADFLFAQENIDALDQRWSELSGPILHYTDTIAEKDFPQVADKIRKFYLQDKHITKETFKPFNKILSDRLFIDDIEKAARLQAKAVSSPVYFYYYNFRDEDSVLDILFTEKKDRLGMVAHGDDLMYILSNPRKDDNPKFTKHEVEMKEFLLDFWTTYAKSGKPTSIPTWKPVQKDSKKFDYLYIKTSNEFSMKSDEELGNGKFWSTIPFEENENLFKTNKTNKEL